MSTREITETIRSIFDNYLELNRLRKTPERYQILEAIYSIEGHFRMEKLQDKLINEKKFHVSRATLYNTVDQLIRAHLITRHQFPHFSEFERVVGIPVHHHQICTQCDAINEFQNETLDRALASIKHFRFTESHRTVCIYGLCPKCESIQKRKQKKY